MLLGDIVVNNARLFPDKIGIVDAQSRQRYRWAEVNERVNRLSHALMALGVNKRDRVGIISENSSQCPELHFALAKIGAIVCPLNYRLHPKQLELIIKDADPKIMFVQNQYADLMDGISSNLQGIKTYIGIGSENRYPREYEALIQEHSASEPVLQIQEDDPVIITYSSGTTDLPKGILSTHKNRIAYALESCLFADRYDHDDVVLVSAPFCAGVSGQIQLVAPALVGAAIVMLVLKGETWGEVIERERVTAMITTKSRMMPVWDFFKKSRLTYDLSSLRKVTTGGQTHSEADLREIMEFCDVAYTAKMYGLSETAATGTRLLPSEVAAGLRPGASKKEKKRLDSVGKSVLSMKMKVVNEEGEEVGPGELGEVLLKGDSVSPMYWNKPEPTERAFKNGWFHTNDMGVLDEDGYLYLKGRKDYMIKSGGFLVSPLEIEQVLLRHAAIKEAAVIGVPHERWGEAVRAIVVLKAGEKITVEELKAHCRGHLAGFQVPKTFEYAERLPRDETGRVQLKVLQKVHSDKG